MEHGYQNIFDFARGKLDNNTNLLSWSGNQNMSLIDTLFRADYSGVTFENVNVRVAGEVVFTKYGKCQAIKGVGLETLLINFKNHGYEVMLFDEKLSIMSGNAALSFSGDRLQLKIGHKARVVYHVRFQQVYRNSAAHPCTDYEEGGRFATTLPNLL